MRAGDTLVVDDINLPGRPRKHFPDRAATSTERKEAWRIPQRLKRLENVAILDMETDPFDDIAQETIYPFCACLYSYNFKPVVIWNEDFDAFVVELLEAINALPEPYTIYAHNGGKFDYMFLIHKMRGAVSFKGRGIMSAKIGQHEIRDSFHIIPEKLESYRKEKFDYSWMAKNKRNKHRKAIIEYLISDCEYNLQIVKAFLQDFGFKLSIGQAAMAGLRKEYKVAKIGPNTDEWLRQYFFGGRVECLAGRGHFVGNYKLYDVNSMYPYVMANFRHPVGNNYSRRRTGGITGNTCFIELTCSNFSALVKRSENNDTSANEKTGRFFTTVWEYEAARDLDMISNIDIHGYIDCDKRSDFRRFIEPLYNNRLVTKAKLKDMKKAGDTESEQYFTVKKDDLFFKLLMNNSYGKFAQNPRKYKENYITDPDAPPPEGFEDTLPKFQGPAYWIWQKPAPLKSFNNVGTAASITGAARAVLMRAIAGAVDPIYCDTDSLICRKMADDTFIDATKLGAWDLEDEFSEVIIAGKKTYACHRAEFTGKDDEFKIRSKGVPEGRLGWSEMLRLLQGEIIEVTSFGPTLTRFGKQFYMTRNIRATAPIRERDIHYGT